MYSDYWTIPYHSERLSLTNLFTRTHARTRTHTHARTRTHAHTHAQKQTHTHAHMHAHTHICKHTNTRSHTRTHRSPHPHLDSWILPSPHLFEYTCTQIIAPFLISPSNSPTVSSVCSPTKNHLLISGQEASTQTLEPSFLCVST